MKTYQRNVDTEQELKKDTRPAARNTKQERKIWLYLMLTVLEPCKTQTQLLTNLTPDNG